MFDFKKCDDFSVSIKFPSADQNLLWRRSFWVLHSGLVLLKLFERHALLKGLKRNMFEFVLKHGQSRNLIRLRIPLAPLFRFKRTCRRNIIGNLCPNQTTLAGMVPASFGIVAHQFWSVCSPGNPGSPEERKAGKSGSQEACPPAFLFRFWIVSKPKIRKDPHPGLKRICFVCFCLD